MSRPTPEEYESAGLYDPDDTTIVGRLELLEWLSDLGFTIADMQEADAVADLNSMAGDRWLVPDARLTRAEMLERTGLDADLFDEYSAALGLMPIQSAPVGEVGYNEGIVNLLDVVDALLQSFSRQEALGLVRVIGSSMARIAEAAVSMFLIDVESELVRERRSERDLAQASYAAAQLIDGMGERLDPLLRRQLLQAIERTRATSVDGIDRFRHRYAVGFVDLVGFTPLSGNMSAEELSGFIGRFEGRSHGVVTREGARVVKLIGDEVMFVAADPSAVCRAGRAMIDEFNKDGDGVLPRGGLAYGSVVLRGGDYYGPVVNLASRLTDEAVPGELLVSDQLAQAADDCAFERAGRRMVKGFEDPITVHSLLPT